MHNAAPLWARTRHMVPCCRRALATDRGGQGEKTPLPFKKSNVSADYGPNLGLARRAWGRLIVFSYQSNIVGEGAPRPQLG